MLISFADHQRRITDADIEAAAEVAAAAELVHLRRAMAVRLHLDELQDGTLPRIQNVVSFAAHAGRH